MQLNVLPEPAVAADYSIDVRQDVCPMTFVRCRLMLDRMQPGQVLEVLFAGAEPARNLPRTAMEQGHQVLSEENGRLLLRKG